MAHLQFLKQYLHEYIGHRIESIDLSDSGELTLEVSADSWLEVADFLRRNEMTSFDQLIDLCGVDYLTYGKSEWDVSSATSSGFSRAVNAVENDPFDFADESVDEFDGKRFAVVIHLLSVKKGRRLRVRTRCDDNDFPVLSSLVGIWSSANWYEREAFDLFGIMFERHPDLRRILTDYGFVGHPFRKDFPLEGHVEMRYDAEKKRVVYEPVSIEPRVLVPRVIRKDQRFSPEARKDECFSSEARKDKHFSPSERFDD
uniref:NADH-quinone oxidoreductase subunit C n=1 Tax=uncultured Thiotrichaceae bacterium TaxID=298394 RepID=A0A6S6UJR1_9GAMM|nr:MAG: NADH-ubiquinone oxidoreductase chain C (EC [uncultured Thiotrichaceae bacterium]